MTTERLLIPIHCDHDRRLEYLTLDQLEEFQEDLVELSPEGYAHLRDSILKHGIIAPIFFWRNPDDPEHTPKILDGHQRKKVCTQEGWQIEGGAWPVVDIQAPTEQAAAEILLQLRGQHGQMSDQGLYDFITGKDIELDSLLDFDLPGFDLEDFKADFVPELAAGNTDPDEVPPEPEEPVTQTGDLWLMGGHRLLCGDSAKAEDVERLMDGEQADMVFTDPPYGINLDTDWSKLWGKEHRRVTGDDRVFDVQPYLEIVPDVDEQFWWGADNYLFSLPMGGSWIVWDKRTVKEENETPFGDFELCWSKQRHKREIVDKSWGQFFGLQSQDTNQRMHPNQKPTEIIEFILNKYSPQSAIIIDFFLGSGSTIIACEKIKRFCRGVEIDALYCDVIVHRWQNYTGQQAILDGDGRTFAEIAEERGVAV